MSITPLHLFANDIYYVVSCTLHTVSIPLNQLSICGTAEEDKNSEHSDWITWNLNWIKCVYFGLQTASRGMLTIDMEHLATFHVCQFTRQNNKLIKAQDHLVWLAGFRTTTCYRIMCLFLEIGIELTIRH